MTSEDIRTHSRTGTGGEHIVAVTGQVDLATAEPFQRALDDAAAGRTRLTVDLTGLGFLDSAGIKILFGLAARLDLILLVDLRSVIATTLEVSGLGEAATIRAVD